MKAGRSQPDNPRAFDAVVALLMTGILLGAYVDSYAHVKVPGSVFQDPAAVGAITVCWFLLTGFLFLSFWRGLRQGRPCRAPRSTDDFSGGLPSWPSGWMS